MLGISLAAISGNLVPAMTTRIHQDDIGLHVASRRFRGALCLRWIRANSCAESDTETFGHENLGYVSRNDGHAFQCVVNPRVVGRGSAMTAFSEKRLRQWYANQRLHRAMSATLLTVPKRSDPLPAFDMSLPNFDRRGVPGETLDTPGARCVGIPSAASRAFGGVIGQAKDRQVVREVTNA